MRLVAAPAIAVFAFFFVTVSSRIVGLVGVTSNPTSGMTIVTLVGVSLVFVALGWTDALGMATVLTVDRGLRGGVDRRGYLAGSQDRFPGRGNTRTNNKSAN